MANKKEKKTVGQNFCDNIKSLDWFGLPVTFMIDGDSTYKTWIGAIATVLISIWCLLFFYDEVKPILYAEEVPKIATVVNKGFYPVDNPVDFKKDDFHFAIGLSSKKRFKD